jgi:hypothetical protein
MMNYLSLDVLAAASMVSLQTPIGLLLFICGKQRRLL